MKKQPGLLHNYMELLFLGYIFSIMSFSRAFVILHLSVFGFNIYITELVILCFSIFIITNLKFFYDNQSKWFFRGLSLYFLMGSFYLLIAILKQNIFGFRDIVFFGYLLFLPLSFAVFAKNKYNLRLLFIIIIIANIIALIIGRFRMTSFYIPDFIKFTGKIKLFNLGLYYGISSSYLISIFSYIKNKYLKLFIMLIITLNSYMMIFLAERTIWASLIMLFLFFSIILKMKFFKFLLKTLPLIAVIFIVLYRLDFGTTNAKHKKIIEAQVSFLRAFRAIDIVKDSEPLSISQPITNVALLDSATVDAVISYNRDSRIDTSLRLDTSPRIDTSLRTEANPRIDTDLHVDTGIRNNIVNKMINESIIYLDSIKERLDKSKYQGAFDNIIWRVRCWLQTLQFACPSFIRGVGYGVYPKNIGWFSEAELVKPYKYKTIGVNSGIIPAHNHLISIFFKMGIIGLLLFIFINGYIFITGIKYIKRCNSEYIKYYLIGSLGAFVFWHTTALFYDVIDSPATSPFLWIISGLILACKYLDKEVL